MDAEDVFNCTGSPPRKELPAVGATGKGKFRVTHEWLDAMCPLKKLFEEESTDLANTINHPPCHTLDISLPPCSTEDVPGP